MATKSLETREFNPAIDVPAMSDAFLRQHGLNGRGSLPFYRDLARLLAPGSTRLRFGNWTDLADAIVRLRGGDGRGLRHKDRIDAKLVQLCRQGLIGGEDYDLEFLPPNEWQPRVVVDREPELRCVASQERQANLFGTPEDATFRVFGGDEIPPDRAVKTKSAFGFQESAFPEKPKALLVSPDEPYTSSTRAPAVDVDVDDDDEVVSTSPVEIEEIEEARTALREAMAQWRRDRIPGKQLEPNRTNLSTWLKTHTLMRRGTISQAVYDEGRAAVKRTHDTSEIRTNVWTIMWRAWESAFPPEVYGRLLSSLGLPVGWEDTFRGRRPEARNDSPSTGSTPPPPAAAPDPRRRHAPPTAAEIAARRAEIEAEIAAAGQRSEPQRE